LFDGLLSFCLLRFHFFEVGFEVAGNRESEPRRSLGRRILGVAACLQLVHVHTIRGRF